MLEAAAKTCATKRPKFNTKITYPIGQDLSGFKYWFFYIHSFKEHYWKSATKIMHQANIFDPQKMQRWLAHAYILYGRSQVKSAGSSY